MNHVGKSYFSNLAPLFLFHILLFIRRFRKAAWVPQSLRSLQTAPYKSSRNSRVSTPFVFMRQLTVSQCHSWRSSAGKSVLSSSASKSSTLIPTDRASRPVYLSHSTNVSAAPREDKEAVSQDPQDDKTIFRGWISFHGPRRRRRR